MNQPFHSVFTRVFDVAIFGAGWAGQAAARRIRSAGRTVLLVEPCSAVLWETSRAFACDVQAPAPAGGDWAAFIAELSAAGAVRDRFIDGAIAEVAHTCRIRQSGPEMLYYVLPVAAWHDGDLLGAVALATKSGLRVITARQWIDATESGDLLALLAHPPAAAAPESQTLYIHVAGTRWPADDEREIVCPQMPGARLRLRRTMWQNQRVLELTCPGRIDRLWQAWLCALRGARESGALPPDAVVAHGSIAALSTYAGGTTPPQLPPNVASAVPACAADPIRTLADRFALGADAAGRLDRAQRAAGNPPPFDFAAAAVRWRDHTADVAVAGLGTGGALAAVAAAREGVSVVAFDPLPFAGGIPSGGGIHWYYYGVPGGLQDELDARIRDIMPLFGAQEQVAGFHPDARKAALDAMLHEAGVRMMRPAMLFGVDRRLRRVVRGHIAADGGPVRLEAHSWIDATGDGDLAAAAGAEYFLGRTADCQIHAYSQSSGRIALRDGLVRLCLVNYDAGFVDPTDAEDLTRARLEGTAHYLQQTYAEFERPTYIAPAIGIRQGRQIDCDYNLTLADLIERRSFADSIGLTGCHYDNHAVDYEFETDEAMFWVWVCRQWRGNTACEIPYAMLLPRGLENVWMACRAAGLSSEAHHSFRMQRDMHRIGEAAGVASALAVRGRCGSRGVRIAELRQRLAATGALTLRPAPASPFGPSTGIDSFAPAPAPSADQVDRWLAEMRQAAGPAMYHLWRAQDAARGKVLPLVASPDEGISWRAAAIVAMWGDPTAEDRLRLAIRNREYGFDAAESQRPETNNRLVPNWLVAVVLLRRCGTAACLEDLHQLSCQPDLVHNARTAIALTCENLALRLKLSPKDREIIAQTLRKLLATESPNSIGNPQRKPAVPEHPPAASPPTARQGVVEDFRWQLHLAVARAEQAAGLPVHDAAKAFVADPRATVRRAMMMVLQNY